MLYDLAVDCDPCHCPSPSLSPSLSRAPRTKRGCECSTPWSRPDSLSPEWAAVGQSSSNRQESSAVRARVVGVTSPLPSARLAGRLQTPTAALKVSHRHITTSCFLPTAHLLQGCLPDPVLPLGRQSRDPERTHRQSPTGPSKTR